MTRLYAYCQDNELSWYDWANADAGLLQFTERVIRFRQRHPVFCRRRWFQGRPIHGTGVGDIGWLTPGGQEMSEEDWQAAFCQSLGVFLNGSAIPTRNERGEPILDDSFYLMFNTNHEAVTFTLPGQKWGEQWTTLLDTFDATDHLNEEENSAPHEVREAGTGVEVGAWSLVLLRRLQ